MRLSGEAVFLGARYSEASEKFSDSWFVNMADDEGGTLQVFALGDNFPANYQWPDQLTKVSIEVNVRDKQGGGKSASLMKLSAVEGGRQKA